MKYIIFVAAVMVTRNVVSNSKFQSLQNNNYFLYRSKVLSFFVLCTCFYSVQLTYLMNHLHRFVIVNVYMILSIMT